MSAGKAMSWKTVSLVAGIVFLALCLILLVVPVKSGTGDDCGSIIGGAGFSGDGTFLDFFAKTASDLLCKGPLRQRLTASIASGVVGIVLVAVGLVGRSAAMAGTGRSASGSPAVPERTLADQIAEIARLHQAGELTDEEYQSAKARLLGSGR